MCGWPGCWRNHEKESLLTIKILYIYIYISLSLSLYKYNIYIYIYIFHFVKFLMIIVSQTCNNTYKMAIK